MRNLIVDFSAKNASGLVRIPEGQDINAMPFKADEPVFLSDGDGHVQATLVLSEHGWLGLANWDTWKDHEVETEVKNEALKAMVGTMFGTAKPSDEQKATMIQTREDAEELSIKILDRGNGMNACTKIALRKLQEAVVYANRAVLELD